MSRSHVCCSRCVVSLAACGLWLWPVTHGAPTDHNRLTIGSAVHMGFVHAQMCATYGVHSTYPGAMAFLIPTTCLSRHVRLITPDMDEQSTQRRYGNSLTLLMRNGVCQRNPLPHQSNASEDYRVHYVASQTRQLTCDVCLDN